MTYPTGSGDFNFQDLGGAVPSPQSMPLEEPVTSPEPLLQSKGYPEPIIKISDEQKESFLIWLDEWLEWLISDQQKKQETWSKHEDAYRGVPPESLSFEPFKGACKDVIPVVAMAVDPIHARLDTGIFKEKPVFTFRALKAEAHDYVFPLTQFVDFYQRHVLNLRQIASPRILECAKLGTTAFKTVYDREETQVITYDENFEVVTKKELVFDGPRVFGISIGDLLFPPNYQHLQDCPIVAERQRTTFSRLKVLEYSKKLTNVDELKNQEILDRTPLESARERAVEHENTRKRDLDIVVYEVWCDYDINGDGQPERLVATYHKETRTLLQLRYNWYFHQRKPYTVIPYTVSNDSLYGIGIAEMSEPFQLAITRLHRLASDNAYLANIRMFIAKKNSGIEEVPRLYSGRTFFVDDPTKDFVPFGASDTYPSTLTERQNLFGMVEKRTGVSDYLVGRESPIIGTRATATSTLALIQEGTRRVEEVLENLRVGFREVIENCISIWIQYGTNGLEDEIFGGDDIAEEIKEFFRETSQKSVNGMLTVELAAVDATTNKQAQQQMQLAVIQIMMQYLEKLLAAGQGALVAQQQMPELALMIKDVMEAARNMFKDLLHKYSITNVEEYLPDLSRYLNGATAAGPGVVAGTEGPNGELDDNGGVQFGTGVNRAPAPPRPPAPGSGGPERVSNAIAGVS